MSDSGYIYVAFNPEMPDCVKVGMTSRNPRHRVAELSSTSTPVPFRLLMQWAVTDVAAAENAAHRALADLRVAPNREFFRVDGPGAIVLVGEAIRAYLASSENDETNDEIKKACRQTAELLLTRDFRSSPPDTVSSEVTATLEAGISDHAFWLAKWASDEGANPRAILSVIRLVSASLDGYPQTQLSPEELAREFRQGISLLMLLLSTDFYLQYGVGGLLPEALNYASDISNLIAHSLRVADDESDAGVG